MHPDSAARPAVRIVGDHIAQLISRARVNAK
jgi:hypothetical protein